MEQWLSGVIALWLLASIIVGIALVGIRIWLRKRERAMKRARRQEIQQALSEVVVDTLTLLHVQDKINSMEANTIYYMLARQHGWWDFAPRRICKPPPLPEDLKAAIKARCKVKERNEMEELLQS